MKSLSVALSSGGGFKLQAVYLDIVIGVNNFLFLLPHARCSTVLEWECQFLCLSKYHQATAYVDSCGGNGSLCGTLPRNNTYYSCFVRRLQAAIIHVPYFSALSNPTAASVCSASL